MTHTQRIEALERMGLLVPPRELFCEQMYSPHKQAVKNLLKRRRMITKSVGDDKERARRVKKYRQQVENNGEIVYLPWKGT